MTSPLPSPPRLGLVTIALASAFATGCTHSLTSDMGVAVVTFPDTYDINERLVLPGARLCPDQVSDAVTTQTLTDCYAFEGDLPNWDAGCLVPQAPGPATFRLTPQECTVDGAPYEAVADTLSVEAVEPAAVSASLQWLELLAQDPTATLVTPVPTDIVPAPGVTLRVAEGGLFRTNPSLRMTDDGRAVGWSADTYDLEVIGTGATLERPPESDPDQTWRLLTVDSGASADLQATFTGAGTWTLTHVEADAGPFTLEQVVLAVVVGDDGSSEPLGARAVVRNAAGDLVFGAPVAWSSDILQVTPGVDQGLPSSDYTTVADACRDPSTLAADEHATLTATLGDQSVTVGVDWQPAPGNGAAWSAPASCTEVEDTGTEKEDPACGCGSTGARGTSLFGALVGLLALRRRSGARSG